MGSKIAVRLILMICLFAGSAFATERALEITPISELDHPGAPLIISFALEYTPSNPNDYLLLLNLDNRSTFIKPSEANNKIISFNTTHPFVSLEYTLVKKTDQSLSLLTSKKQFTRNCLPNLSSHRLEEQGKESLEEAQELLIYAKDLGKDFDNYDRAIRIIEEIKSIREWDRAE